MFARVTQQNGQVQWINLDHVRQIVVKEGRHGSATLTAIHIDNSWVERVVTVVETPEAILSQSGV
jgi:hypothetical protein